MTIQVFIVLVLTFIIYTISTLTYSVRIAGIRTGLIAICFSIFNIFALIARTSNTIQEPLLAKTIENTIKIGDPQSLLIVFRWILYSTTVATIIGALLMPTFIKIFSKAVVSFSKHRSVPKLFLICFSKSGVEELKCNITMPKKENVVQLKNLHHVPKKIIILNTVAFAASTVGGFAALYAGCINPDLRTTCSTLAAVITGIATLIMTIFVDPYISMLTEDVINGNCAELQFNRCIIFIVFSLIAGTVLAQFLLLPSAEAISLIAKLI